MTFVRAIALALFVLASVPARAHEEHREALQGAADAGRVRDGHLAQQQHKKEDERDDLKDQRDRAVAEVGPEQKAQVKKYYDDKIKDKQGEINKIKADRFENAQTSAANQAGANKLAEGDSHGGGHGGGGGGEEGGGGMPPPPPPPPPPAKEDSKQETPPPAQQAQTQPQNQTPAEIPQTPAEDSQIVDLQKQIDAMKSEKTAVASTSTPTADSDLDAQLAAIAKKNETEVAGVLRDLEAVNAVKNDLAKTGSQVASTGSTGSSGLSSAMRATATGGTTAGQAAGQVAAASSQPVRASIGMPGTTARAVKKTVNGGSSTGAGELTSFASAQTDLTPVRAAVGGGAIYGRGISSLGTRSVSRVSDPNAPVLPGPLSVVMKGNKVVLGSTRSEARARTLR